MTSDVILVPEVNEISNDKVIKEPQMNKNKRKLLKGHVRQVMKNFHRSQTLHAWRKWIPMTLRSAKFCENDLK